VQKKLFISEKTKLDFATTGFAFFGFPRNEKKLRIPILLLLCVEQFQEGHG
jgi:hypothetical protein